MSDKVTKIEEKESVLNDKQQAFIDNMLIKNMSVPDAYMAVYKVKNKSTASSNGYRLLKQPEVKASIASLSSQLKHLAHVPKHLVVQELKVLLDQAKADKNYKYQVEVLDMLNKMMGYYNHDKTVTNIQISQKLDFNGFDPDDTSFIDITPLGNISDDKTSEESNV